jgi:hypothetical protein
MNQGELREAFYLDQINHDELLSLLLSHFGHSSHQPLSHFHRYTKQDPKIELEIELDKNGRINRIFADETFPEKETH